MASWRDLLPDELLPAARLTPQGFYEQGKQVGQPSPQSTKVGWTLRTTGGRVIAAFAFALNPQSIDRTLGSRAQLFATKGANYIDDFGPGAGVITVTQMIASGKGLPGDAEYTHREDFQRFLTTIFLPATQGNARASTRAFFHDNHLERGMDEEVYFPPDCLQLNRSVSQPGVWQVTLQMVSLQKYPFDELVVSKTGRPPGRGTRVYVVRPRDTLEKIARALAGRHAKASTIAGIRREIIRLNPQLKHTRTLPNGHTGKPGRVYVGESIVVPT